MNKIKYLAFQDLLKKILAMIFFILLARILKVDEFSKYQQILLVINLFASLFSAGIPMGISYYHGQSSSYKLKVSVYKRFFYTQLLIAFIGGMVYMILSLYLSVVFKNNYIYDYSLLIVVILFTNTTIGLFKNLSTVTNQLKNYLVITSAVSVISILISTWILVSTSNIFYLICSLAFFSFLTFAILVKFNLKYFLTKNKNIFINKNESKYTISMGSVAIVSMINIYIDQMMVSFLLPLSDYSYIKIGSFQIPFIGIITGTLVTVMIPIISNQYKNNKYNEIIKTWSDSIEKSTILLIPIIIFCLIFAQDIIITFFSKKYDGAIIIFQVYMFQWLRAVVIFGGIMGAIGLEKELLKNTMIITVLNIVINYIMISNYGVIGAAITTTVLNYLALVLLVRKVDQILPKKFISYFPFKIYFTSISLSIFFAFLFKYMLNDYLTSLVYLLACATLFYIIIIFAQMKLIYNDISINKLKSLL